jgi:RNA polymerase sigma factor (sigma-70 family)
VAIVRLNSELQKGGGDDALMAQVAARDAAAFRWLIDAHGPRAQRIGWRMLGDGVEAEDVAQETMLRLWDHAARWKPGGPGVAAWVTRVAMNLCLDRLRRRRLVRDEAGPERADDGAAADAGLNEERLRERVAAAVSALPERQRAAIILTYYEEQSNIMAAQTLDMNVKAFESLLLRARQALRKGFEATGVLTVEDLA